MHSSQVTRGPTCLPRSPRNCYRFDMYATIAILIPLMHNAPFNTVQTRVRPAVVRRYAGEWHVWLSQHRWGDHLLRRDQEHEGSRLLRHLPVCARGR